MQKIFLLNLILIFLFTACNPKTEDKATGFCGHAIGYNERLNTDLEFVRNIDLSEKALENYKENIIKNENDHFRTSLVTIPVVVHVLFTNSTDNISDAQIDSQIEALNEVFRLNNADASSIPSAFQSLASDALIEFTLAQRDPSCNPTNGINRVSTTSTFFLKDNSATSATVRNPMKFSSSGGADAWPSDEYLNIWVCKDLRAKRSDGTINSGIIGYGSFPVDLASRPLEDGIVMEHSSFGTVGTAAGTTFDLGRITVHEAGHWFNLNHIWGDDGVGCTGTDNVADTPNQAGSNAGCPTFPLTDACTGSSPGVMFMNHMDYTDDDCRIMFTADQADRMNGTLYTIRNSILSSQGAVPPPTVATADIWMKDTDQDIGVEPNTLSTSMYRSDDIWVRNMDDGEGNQEHLNPNGGASNFVYVRVRNRGCQTSDAAQLKLYWAKASSGLSWTAPWDGSVTTPALMGEIIDTKPISPIAGGGFSIIKFAWTAPSPSDYTSFGADRTHFCLLARIETSSTSPFDMTFPETSSLSGNVRNNNNIVWKNISVNEAGSGSFASVIVTNYNREITRTTIEFDAEDKDFLNINRSVMEVFNNGKFIIKLSEKLDHYVEENPAVLIGITPLGNALYELRKPIGRIQGVDLPYGEFHIVDVNYEHANEKPMGRSLINLQVNQINDKTNKRYGGQNFKFITN